MDTSQRAEVMALESIDHSRHQLHLRFRVDALRFTTTYWYGDVDLHGLRRRFGDAFMDKVLFHIAAFEANKLASLEPHTFDLGPYAKHHTEAFEELWRTIFRKVWAQWRYENDRPDYTGPVFASTAVADSVDAVESPQTAESAEVLAFCGGGKDSLVALGLLEGAGIPYASYAYSSSIYGRADEQHTLIDRLVDHCAPVRHHRQWIYEDFMDSPVLQLGDTAPRTLTAAETPASMFGALPVLLEHGYRHMALAHEASANTGNLIWNATGEDVNHQWGKSLEAERLLDGYLRRELLADGRYFSLLQPIFDPVIFFLLNRHPEAVRATHSCNVAKPWCEQCAKCAYVYMGYMAYLPTEVVAGMFQHRLFERPETQEDYRMMIGATDHTPFECIGQVDESRLALELCRRKGLEGAALDTYAAHVSSLDVGSILERHFQVDTGLDTLPPSIATGVIPQMESAARGARDHVERLLSRNP